MKSKRQKAIYSIFTCVAVFCGIIWSVTNLGYDGEYQIAMSYRLLQGDRMFLEMWEPHQTSVFLPAALMWVYGKLFHTTTGIVLYLQVCGILIRGGIALLLYRIFRGCLEKPLAYGAALLYFMVSPKDYALPEFSNLQLWYGTLLLCCLLVYLRNGKRRYLVLGAGCLCLEVLAYPSCAIVYFGAVGLLAAYSRDKWRDIAVFTGVCAGAGAAAAGWFVWAAGGLERFAECIAGMLALEPTHTEGAASKLSGYGRDVLEILAALFAVGAVGAAASLAAGIVSGKGGGLASGKGGLASGKGGLASGKGSRLASGKGSGLTSEKGGGLVSEKGSKRDWRGRWFLCCGALLLAGFFFNILSAEHRCAYSVIFLFMAGAGLYCAKVLGGEERRIYVCGSVVGGLGLLATLILSDLPFSASVAYGLPAFVCALIPIRRKAQESADGGLERGVCVCFLCFAALLAVRCVCVRTPLTGRGQICSSFSNLSVVRSGPALGLISDEEGVCIQRDSYPEWKEWIRQGDKVWIVGGVPDTLGYLYEDVEVAAPSTMSTPYYSGAVLDYWRLNPDKYPDVIAAESYMGNLSYELQMSRWLLDFIEEEYQPEYVIDGKYWKYYFRKAR